MTASCEIFQGCPDSDIPYIRELLALDVLCPASCTFVRNEIGQLGLYVPPSPLHWSRQGEWPWVIRNAELQSHHRVLDAGSGWSVLKFALAKRCCHVVALELEEEAIRTAQVTIDGLGFSDRIVQVGGDVRFMPFPSDWFDRTVCVSVIEHMPEGPVEAVKELIRVTKPGGRMLLTMDVRITGPVVGDFYLGVDSAREILSMLDIPLPLHGQRLMGSKQMDDQIEVVVLMVRYDKPE